MSKPKNERTTRKSLLPRAERTIVAPDALAGWQRRAEALGLIVHAQAAMKRAGAARKQKDARRK